MHHLQSVDSVADPKEGPGPPLFLSQTETRRAEQISLTPGPPPPIISWSG